MLCSLAIRSQNKLSALPCWRDAEHGELSFFKMCRDRIFFQVLSDLTLSFYIVFSGIVVEDCLILLQNLLKNNNSNQNFFKEGSYIQRMKPWFEVGDENSGWSAQEVTNLHLMLQVYWTLDINVIRILTMILSMESKLLLFDKLRIFSWCQIGFKNKKGLLLWRFAVILRDR